MGGMEGIINTQGFSNAIQYGYYFVIALGAMAFLGTIAYFMIILMRYKHRVRILEVVGDAIQESNDKAALLKDEKTKKAFQFKLMKNKVTLPPPAADSYILDKKGRKIIYIAKISPTDYVYVKPGINEFPMLQMDVDKLNKFIDEEIRPMYSYIKISDKLTKKEIELTPLDQDTLFWYVNQLEHDNEKYKNRDQKWYQNPMVMGLATMAVCLIILIVTFKYAGGWQATAKETALELMEAGKGYVGQVVN